MATRKKAPPPAAGTRRRPAVKTDTAARLPSAVIGIGASAGGLEALEQWLRHTPADTGMAFVVVQHLDPTHPSLLVEILQRATDMPVVEARDRMPVLPDRVHVMPPNRVMGLAGGKLRLKVPAELRTPRMPIDDFFRSLAKEQADRAVGIVLSGTGTDGTLGLRAIFDAGGLCLVQDPATAKFDGMPSSAIQAGCVDKVLPADQLTPALLQGGSALAAAAAAKTPAASVPATAAADDGGLAAVLAQLRSGSGHDFTQYKKSTVRRRIERRMAQRAIDRMPVYARYVKENPAELQLLFRELLINVTSFFRDAEAFAVLKRKVMPMLIDGKADGATLRIWVAGCASGEEVYSVAMVVREYLQESGKELKVQLYGTDLDDEAIKAARAGLYTADIAADVGRERLRRYFTREETGYRVNKELRDMTIFAVQSLVKDPPFTRLDLLCCRNVMIYLEPELQDRLIPIFHYALNPGGVLFLSPSESIGRHAELFEVSDRKWKLYRARPLHAAARTGLADQLSWMAGKTSLALPVAPQRADPRQMAELAKRALLQSYAPAAVLVDLQGSILYVHGDTGPYLRPAPGEPTHSLVEMAREGLQLPLREALRTVAAQGLPATSHATLLSAQGERRAVSLNVRPLPEPTGSQAVLLVSFQPADEPTPATPARTPGRRPTAEAQRCAELEHELAHVKESLRMMLEEQQISNEELKSTNEELQSTNEELQSTNEELETSKEELQSVNEELVTVNAELQSKIEQMGRIQDDMKNLLDNLQLGVIFLDRQLKLRRFTRDATQLFRLLPSDIGRPLSDIRSELLDADLLADAQVVLDSLVPTEREARTAAGRCYLARVQPYRTVDHVVEGVVMTFADVTLSVEAIAAREALALAEGIVDAVDSPLVVLDARHHVLSANRAYYEAFQDAPKQTVGLDLLAIGQGRWNLPAVRALLEAPWPTGKAGLATRQAEIALPGAGALRCTLGVRRVLHQPAGHPVMLLSIVAAPAGPAALAGAAPPPPRAAAVASPKAHRTRPARKA